MELDQEKIDQAILGLLYLNYESDMGRTWKSFDWDAMDRLHAKGYISEPRSKSKSVRFTEAGLDGAKRAFQKLFCN